MSRYLILGPLIIAMSFTLPMPLSLVQMSVGFIYTALHFLQEGPVSFVIFWTLRLLGGVAMLLVLWLLAEMAEEVKG